MCLMAGELPLEKWKRKPRTFETPKPSITPEGFRAAVISRRRAEAAAGVAAAAHARRHALSAAPVVPSATSNGAVHSNDAQMVSFEGGGESGAATSEPAGHEREAPTSDEGTAEGADGPVAMDCTADRCDNPVAVDNTTAMAAIAEPAEASEACADPGAHGEERSSGGNAAAAAGDVSREARCLHLEEKARRRVRAAPPKSRFLVRKCEDVLAC